MDDARSTALEWIRLAKQDSSSAIYLRNKHPAPVEIICYHCQQAVEKLLKATLVLHNINPPRTHDLDTLCALCAEQGVDISDVQDECTLLTSYAIHTRYPFEQQLEERDMLMALSAVDKIENSTLMQELEHCFEQPDAPHEDFEIQMQ